MIKFVLLGVVVILAGIFLSPVLIGWGKWLKDQFAKLF